MVRNSWAELGGYQYDLASAPAPTQPPPGKPERGGQRGRGRGSGRVRTRTGRGDAQEPCTNLPAAPTAAAATMREGRRQPSARA